MGPIWVESRLSAHPVVKIWAMYEIRMSDDDVLEDIVMFWDMRGDEEFMRRDIG